MPLTPNVTSSASKERLVSRSDGPLPMMIARSPACRSRRLARASPSHRCSGYSSSDASDAPATSAHRAWGSAASRAAAAVGHEPTTTWSGRAQRPPSDRADSVAAGRPRAATASPTPCGPSSRSSTSHNVGSRYSNLVDFIARRDRSTATSNASESITEPRCAFVDSA